MFRFVSERLGTEEWAPLSVDTVARPHVGSDAAIGKPSRLPIPIRRVGRPQNRALVLATRRNGSAYLAQPPSPGSCAPPWPVLRRSESNRAWAGSRPSTMLLQILRLLIDVTFSTPTPVNSNNRRRPSTAWLCTSRFGDRCPVLDFITMQWTPCPDALGFGRQTWS